MTHWSSRLLGRHLGIGDAIVARAWRKYGVQSWRSESFRFSTDPELVAKVTDVVGLYLAPPQSAVVLCVDEKSQNQALDRAAPILPLQPGLAERRSHDYVRQARPRCSPRWRSPPGKSPRRANHGTATPSSLRSSSKSPWPTPMSSFIW